MFELQLRSISWVPHLVFVHASLADVLSHSFPCLREFHCCVFSTGIFCVEVSRIVLRVRVVVSVPLQARPSALALLSLAYHDHMQFRCVHLCSHFDLHRATEHSDHCLRVRPVGLHYQVTKLSNVHNQGSSRPAPRRLGQLGRFRCIGGARRQLAAAVNWRARQQLVDQAAALLLAVQRCPPRVLHSHVSDPTSKFAKLIFAVEELQVPT